MSQQSQVPIYKPKISHFNNKAALYKRATEFLETRILDIQENLGLARLLLAGGSTPFPVYQSLARSVLINWSRVEIYQTDERHVSPNSDLSNQKKILTSFQEIASEITFHFFNTQIVIEKTVEDYQELLDQLDEVWFDQTVLGIGEDGHFASLFPKGNYLKHQDYNVIQTTAPDNYEVPERVSLTVETVLNSQEILVLLVGKNKEQVLVEMLEGQKSAQEFPAKFLLAHPKVEIYCAFEN